jgi:hypothetical protein
VLFLILQITYKVLSLSYVLFETEAEAITTHVQYLLDYRIIVSISYPIIHDDPINELSLRKLTEETA